MNAIRYIPASSSDLPATFSVANAKLPQTYENAKTALANCASIDECQEWADKAEALASYAKMADDDTLRKLADRIQARAVRRMGELLKQFDGRGDHRKSDGAVISSPTQKEVADQAGISDRQRTTAVRVANVPAEQFEKQVESPTPPTVTKLAEQGTKKREATPARPAGFSAATSLIGAVEDFAEFCRSQNPETIAAAVMSHEVTDLREHVATIDSWLDRFVVNLEG
jgi:hypothetical protein